MVSASNLVSTAGPSFFLIFQYFNSSLIFTRFVDISQRDLFIQSSFAEKVDFLLKNSLWKRSFHKKIDSFSWNKPSVESSGLNQGKNNFHLSAVIKLHEFIKLVNKIPFQKASMNQQSCKWFHLDASYVASYGIKNRAEHFHCRRNTVSFDKISFQSNSGWCIVRTFAELWGLWDVSWINQTTKFTWIQYRLTKSGIDDNWHGRSAAIYRIVCVNLFCHRIYFKRGWIHEELSMGILYYSK